MTNALPTPSVQIKVTLPFQLQQCLQSKADHYGLTLSGYIKHLILNDVKDLETPAAAVGSQRMTEPRQVNRIESIDDFIDSL